MEAEEDRSKGINEKGTFEQYLNNYTSLSESSKTLYRRVITMLITSTGTSSPTIGELNKFIINKSEKRQPHVKYAIKEYLKYLGRENECLELVQAKLKEPIRDKVFLSRENMEEIISLIENEKHKVIALLQYNTGARASEILTMRKHRIKIEKYITPNNEEKQRIRINVRGKGEKPRYLYLLIDFWKYIKPYYDNSKDYIFFREGELTYLGFWSQIENAYKRYLESLKKAASQLDINIGTHDLRRSFANDIKTLTNDITQVQKMLGHRNINTTIKYLQNKNEDIAASMLESQKDFEAI